MCKFCPPLGFGHRLRGSIQQSGGKIFLVHLYVNAPMTGTAAIVYENNQDLTEL
jgi:hypothetical protein